MDNATAKERIALATEAERNSKFAQLVPNARCAEHEHREASHVRPVFRPTRAAVALTVALLTMSLSARSAAADEPATARGPIRVSAAAGGIVTGRGASDSYIIGELALGYRIAPAISLGLAASQGEGIGAGLPRCGGFDYARSFSRAGLEARVHPFAFGVVEPWIALSAGLQFMQTIQCGTDTVGTSPGPVAYAGGGLGVSFFLSPSWSVDAAAQVRAILSGGGQAEVYSYPSGSSPWTDFMVGVSLHLPAPAER